MDTKVYMASIEGLPYQRLYDAAGAERKAKADAMRFTDDKRRCIAADALLRFCLQDWGIRDYRVLADENGKPFLEGLPVHFNLSHSGSFVLCALSAAPVGCDIQQLGSRDMKLARRFFCPEEAAFVEAAQDREAAFYRLWTLKESYIKALGRGLSQSLNSFCLKLNDNGASLTGNSPWHFREYALPGYRCAVCSHTDQISDLICVTL